MYRIAGYVQRPRGTGGAFGTRCAVTLFTLCRPIDQLAFRAGSGRRIAAEPREWRHTRSDEARAGPVCGDGSWI